MKQGPYVVTPTTGNDGSSSPSKAPEMWKTIQKPVLTWLACSATAALLAGTNFVDAATAFNGGLGATVGIIAAKQLMPKHEVAGWILPIAVPGLVGGRLDGVVVGTGVVATVVYTKI